MKRTAHDAVMPGLTRHPGCVRTCAAWIADQVRNDIRFNVLQFSPCAMEHLG
jgi:hypothetical protein